ncbi:MAG: 1-pyrroline-5-carboxylate dehydrogenase [Bogoriella megaspora]|nr:MAG: 1-pyrroline-5-carboxylate dehydrogenase [Bogoriella megaspora]
MANGPMTSQFFSRTLRDLDRTVLRHHKQRTTLLKSFRPSNTRTMAGLAAFKVPTINNEPNKHYAKGSSERQGLSDALRSLKSRIPFEVPIVVGGKETKTSSILNQSNPASHADTVCRYSNASQEQVKEAIEAALAAKPAWESLPFADRAAVFLKAADLISTKYRYDIMAATMVGQGKNAWQAEIDSAAEICDFFRFNVQYAQDTYAHQPVHNSPGVWNRVEYRPLEGFVYAITPFNFTAIAGNLPGAPALMGNVVIWKPSPSAIASNWLVYQILLEAGLPPNVIQFVPGDAVEVTKTVLSHPEFSALHYTGSTAVFRSLFSQIANGIADDKYNGYPRIVGETGGKNFHVVHHTANIHNAAINTVRGAFEYQGQKCSACSRAYIPSSLADDFISTLVSETKKLKVGDPEDFSNFIGPIIHEASFKKLSGVIDDAKNDKELELLCGGTYDGSKGYYIHPTIYRTTNPNHDLMKRELFGPVLCIYVYDDKTSSSSSDTSNAAAKQPTQSSVADEAFSQICNTITRATPYALTGAVFASSRPAIRQAEEELRNAAGNFYINCKCTGAVVGQQPFGGARASGTNDKAGSANLLSRFVSMRAVKEEFVETGEVEYPSNKV